MTVRNADLSLRDLRVLDVLLRERSLTRAAEQLGTTQPSISKVLARLRTRFGDPLLTRSGQEMHPTPRALEIERPLRGLLLSADVLDRSTPAFAPATSDRTFKLLLSDVGMVIFLPPLTRRLAQEGARLRVHAVPLDSRHFDSKLESGEVDLALGAFTTAAPGLRRQRLYTEGYVGVARADHPQRSSLARRPGGRAAPHIIVMASGTGHAAHRIVQGAIEARWRRRTSCCACRASSPRRSSPRKATASPPSRRGSRRSSPDRSASRPSSRSCRCPRSRSRSTGTSATTATRAIAGFGRYASTCSAGRAGLERAPCRPE